MGLARSALLLLVTLLYGFLLLPDLLGQPIDALLRNPPIQSILLTTTIYVVLVILVVALTPSSR